MFLRSVGAVWLGGRLDLKSLTPWSTSGCWVYGFGFRFSDVGVCASGFG